MGKFALGSVLFRAILAERVLTILTRFVDVLMIGFIAADPNHGIDGVTKAFLIVTPTYFFFCLGIVCLSDALLKKGVDVTGLETIRELEHAILLKTQWVKRLVQRILMSKRLIFWIGSWFYLDPDYVTLLLRKNKEGYVSTFLRITLPSVVLSMAVWLGVYWAGFQGYSWAIWMISD